MPEAPDARPVASGVVWARAEKNRRVPLTRATIVAAAVRLADAQGLAAVTVRRLAEELDARPMSIYSYAQVESKEELFDLMIDEVCGEMLVADLPGDWQQALRATATRCRAVLLQHPWWVELIGRNVLVGPNGTRYREQTLAAVHPLPTDAETKHAAVLAVETFVVGQVTLALDNYGAAKPDGRTAKDWRQAHQEYQQALISTGDFPHLASAGPPPDSPESRDKLFTQGLEWLLTGIAMTLEAH
jgi:AcrR family transcriptional regulator